MTTSYQLVGLSDAPYAQPYCINKYGQAGQCEYSGGWKKDAAGHMIANEDGKTQFGAYMHGSPELVVTKGNMGCPADSIGYMASPDGKTCAYGIKAGSGTSAFPCGPHYRESASAICVVPSSLSKA